MAPLSLLQPYRGDRSGQLCHCLTENLVPIELCDADCYKVYEVPTLFCDVVERLEEDFS